MTYDKKHPTDNTITNDASDRKASTTINHRRNSLKKMAIGTTILGGATATQWSQPIINSVISPAHAQATSSSCSGSQTFDSPGEFEFIVPDCVTQVTVEVRGAGGGGSVASENIRDTISGGIGGLSTGTLQTSPGEILTIIVSERGGDVSDSPLGEVIGAIGGFGYGNGGDGDNAFADAVARGAGGGGGSAILQNGSAIVIAGGGGGAAALHISYGTSVPFLSGRAGDGGGTSGGNSTITGGGVFSDFGGSGGSNGVGGVTPNSGGDGGPRDGGGGRGFGGGGGGGGGFGGGSVGFGGGGGGSLAGPNGTTETGGGNSGNGSITISW